MASKYTERVTIPLTEKEKRNWQHAVDISEYRSIPHMVRDIVDFLCDVIEDETRQLDIIVKLVDSDLIDGNK